MYTDALIESSTKTGRMLGVHGLVELLNEIQNQINEPAELVPTLVDRLTQEDADDLKGDDVTVLLLSANGTKAEWGKMLLAPFYAVRGLFKGSPIGPG